LRAILIEKNHYVENQDEFLDWLRLYKKTSVDSEHAVWGVLLHHKLAHAVDRKNLVHMGRDQAQPLVHLGWSALQIVFGQKPNRLFLP
jgi:hypothetical protein